MGTWEFSERQGSGHPSICKLHRLTQNGNGKRFSKKLKQIQALIAELKSILASEKKAEVRDHL